jgi:hypothetical protein
MGTAYASVENVRALRTRIGSLFALCLSAASCGGQTDLGAQAGRGSVETSGKGSGSFTVVSERPTEGSTRNDPIPDRASRRRELPPGVG